MISEPLQPIFNVSDFIAVTNQALETVYPSVMVEGEVASFKINQGKFVFFDLKDEQSTVGCFMMAFALHAPLKDGMKVRVRARAKLTQWGKFSLTIDSIQPIGEGSVKKSFELLRAKLEAEGLFAAETKRMLPWWPRRVAVISSKQAAGYADFMKIAESRVSGVHFLVQQVQVQGLDAPPAIAEALQRANQLSQPPEVIVVVRGGGSADDLAAFNDERVVRAIAASRVPVLTGIGHEVDTTLADLAADVRAATPTHAATVLLPTTDEVRQRITQPLRRVQPVLQQLVAERRTHVAHMRQAAHRSVQVRIAERRADIAALRRVIRSLDPRAVLQRGYAILRGDPSAHNATIQIETSNYNITAKVLSYDKKEAHN